MIAYAVLFSLVLLLMFAGIGLLNSIHEDLQKILRVLTLQRQNREER